MDVTRRHDGERKRSQESHDTSTQFGAVGRREKKGWVAALLTTVQFKEVQQGCWEPQVSQEYACLCPACAQHGRVTTQGDFRGWCSLQLQGAPSWPPHPPISTKFLPYPYRAMILRFQYRRSPYKAERSKYSTPKCSGMGRIFLLSLFIFYNVQHKMPGLHF